MNDFLLHVSLHDSILELSPGTAPFGKSKTTQLNLSDNATLFLRKDLPGDIHVANTEHSALILSGYIAESSLLTSFASQENACNQLCLHMGEICSFSRSH